MSDTEKDGFSDCEKKARVSWVYQLSKLELISLLRSVPFAEDLDSLSFEQLRKVAVEAVRDGRITKPQPDTEVFTRTMNDSRSNIFFKLGRDEWSAFEERLELYFIANDVGKSKQVAELLIKVDDQTYTLIRSLCSPKKPKDMTYEDLILLVREHLEPAPSEAMERCTFNRAQQTRTESVADFLARLKRLALHCNFKDLEEALRDQIVVGIRDQETREELFRTPKLTFKKAVSLALSRESATRDAFKAKELNRSPTIQETELNNISHARTRNQQQQSSSFGVNQRGSAQRPNFKHPGLNENGRRNEQNSFVPSNAFVCYCCGLPNHYARDCSLNTKTCEFCGMKGHVKAACFKKNRNNGNRRRFHRVNHLAEDQPNDDTEEKHIPEDEDVESSDFYPLILDVDVDNHESRKSETELYNSGTSHDIIKPFVIDLKINNIPIVMEVDTGSLVSVMSEKVKKSLFPFSKLEKSNLVLRCYNGIKIVPLGVMTNVAVMYRDSKRYLNLYVLQGAGPNLIGRHWICAFNLWPPSMSMTDSGKYDTSMFNYATEETKIMEMLKFKYPSLFSKKQGNFTGRKVKLVFKPNTVPVQLKPYHVPFALKEKVTNEIKRLTEAGNLEEVNISAWATPIIPVLKSNGEVRLCGNFKLTVNPNLIVKRHPVPTKEQIFHILGVGQKWSQIDLKHAFMQFTVDESSRDALTIITENGLFRYTKLPEGIASSPGECQDILEEILKGIPHVAIYLDNIYCTGKSDREHLSTLDQICFTLNEVGMKVNPKKCDFMESKLEILGFSLDREGLKPSSSKVRAITEAPIPKNTRELKAFLGLVIYYENFLKDRAAKLQPLYSLLKRNDEWLWDRKCQEALDWVKHEISSDKVLTMFDPNKQLVLACDASFYGLSAILSHRFDSGVEKPICFASKIIPKNELHRAILDKEAAAIIFGFKKFYQFV